MHRRRRNLSKHKTEEQRMILKKVKEAHLRRKREKEEAKRAPFYLRPRESPVRETSPEPEKVKKEKSKDSKVIMLDKLIEEQNKMKEEEARRWFEEQEGKKEREAEVEARWKDEVRKYAESNHPGARVLAVNINIPEFYGGGGGGLFDLFFGPGGNKLQETYSGWHERSLNYSITRSPKNSITSESVRKRKQKRENKKRYSRPEKAPAKRRNLPRPKHGCNRQNYGQLHNKR